MGTLYNQQPRQDSIVSYVETITYIGERLFPGKEQKEMTAEDWMATAAVAEAAFKIQDGDAKDEQLAGFAELLSEFLSRVESSKFARLFEGADI